MKSDCSDREEWRPVFGYEGLYDVSSQGRVRSRDRIVTRKDGQQSRRKGRTLAPSIDRGYMRISLCKGNVKVSSGIHRLVLEAFIGPRPEGMECCHYDGNPGNNRLENLRWGTPKENYEDTDRIGRNFAKNKTHCPRGHKLAAPNLVPRVMRMGYRECLSCSRAHAYVQRKPFLKASMQEISDSYYEDILKKESSTSIKPQNRSGVFFMRERD